jgi:dihydrofolate reductase
MIKMIACVDADGGIGKDNKLLPHLPKDLEHFKNTTLGEVCVFGRKTYDSLPFKPLKDRVNVVLTRNKKASYEGCKTARSIEEVVKMSKEQDIYICGGDNVYEQFMPHADELIISQLEEVYDADTFFPEINSNIWLPYSCEGVEDDKHFEIIKYRRK